MIILQIKIQGRVEGGMQMGSIFRWKMFGFGVHLHSFVSFVHYFIPLLFFFLFCCHLFCWYTETIVLSPLILFLLYFFSFSKRSWASSVSNLFERVLLLPHALYSLGSFLLSYEYSLLISCNALAMLLDWLVNETKDAHPLKVADLFKNNGKFSSKRNRNNKSSQGMFTLFLDPTFNITLSTLSW